MIVPHRRPTDGLPPSASAATPATANVRERLLLRRAGMLILAASVALGVTVLIAIWHSPRDPLVVAQMLAALVLGLGLAGRHVMNRRLSGRQETRDAGMTRMLQGMSRSGSPEAIVEAIVDELRRTADADHIVVARLRPIHRVVETTLVSSRAVVPPSRSIMPAGVLDPFRAPADRRRRRSASARRSAQAVADDLAAQMAGTYALSNTLAAPLVADEQVVGAVILSRRQEREWTDGDRQLLAWSAEELSAALARAYAYEEAEIRANIDALTGLPNRRYLEQLLATVAPRRRSADRLGALMIDLDHFKRLNDRFGHATGDQVLRAVAEAIFDAVRADDTPARYGGEEFAVVLRRATSQQAVDVAERIRRQIGAIQPGEMGIDTPLSVSIGVAVADETDADATAVLVAADGALYRAKREGRDRVVLAG